MSSVLIGMFLNHVHLLLPVLLSALSIAGAQSPTSCDPNLLKIGLCQNVYPLAVQLVAIPCQQTITAGQSATPCIPLLPCINYAPGQPQPSLPSSNSTEQPHQSPCASQTVTPYPPVAAQPGNTETNPGGSHTTVKPEQRPCSNYTVTPYPPVAAQPGNSESDPSASHPTNPNGNEGSFTPPCAPPATTTTTPAPPCVTPPSTATTPTPPCAPPATTTTTPAPPCVTPPTSATTPAPEQIRSCPAGTVLRNGACRQIYCASGAYINGGCVRVRCPAGTTWTADRCAPPQPKELERIQLKPIIIETTQNISLNNELNPLVNEFISIQQSQSDYEDEDEVEDEDESEEALPAPSGNSSRCCHVISPRTCRCKTGSDHWKCYNRRQQLCGDFCSTSKMVLKPSAVRFWQEKDEQILLMPPNWNANCQGNCTAAAARYDCSGCAYNLATSCSPYCFNYICNSPNCSFQDQEEFCESSLATGTFVCPSANGWV